MSAVYPLVGVGSAKTRLRGCNYSCIVITAVITVITDPCFPITCNWQTIADKRAAMWNSRRVILVRGTFSDLYAVSRMHMKTSAMSAKAQDEYDKRFGSLANHYVNGNRQTPQQLTTPWAYRLICPLLHVL